jgi:hypothetical protein
MKHELDITALVAAIHTLLYEIDAARNLRISFNGILDDQHPICVQADILRGEIASREMLEESE